MNITIITILLPYPLDSGGAQAQYNMIDVLRHKNKISLIYPENAHNSKKATSILKKMWPEVIFHPFSYLKQLSYIPFLISKASRAAKLIVAKNSNSFKKERILKPYGYDLSPIFIKHIMKCIKYDNPDIIQIEFYPYLGIVNSLPINKKKIFIHHEIRYIRNERFLKQLKYNKKDIAYLNLLKREELQNLNKYDEVVTLTEDDKKLLLKDGVFKPISVSPAAVNAKVLPYTKWNKTLCFIGGHNHGPNIEGITWLFKEVLPLINWKEYPKIIFKIIGKGWNKHSLPKIDGLEVDCTGFVEDLESEAYGGIMLVPILSGSGMRMKILEGAAMSMPIITTSVGMEGIDMEDHEACIIEDSPQEFAKKLTILFSDDVLRKKIAINANCIFKNNYSKEALANIRNNIYKKLLSK